MLAVGNKSKRRSDQSHAEERSRPARPDHRDRRDHHGLNPQFASQVNLMNLANQIGLFGLFAIGVGFVIITGGIELSVGSMFALLGIFFLDMLVNYELALAIALLMTLIGGALLRHHPRAAGDPRLKMQPFVVTLCGLLIYRGIARWYTATPPRALATEAATRRSNG
jgi:ribose/xylose/arabinose/galactoside ABC-type transport system permease subunit